MFSIISVYNNREILNDWLLNSLKKQTVAYELILIDNTKGRFTSVAAALNYGATLIQKQSDYIMFAHQDIRLLSDTWLEDASTYLDSLEDLGIAGVSGARSNSRGKIEIVSNIKHGVPCKKLRKRIFIKNPEKVQTVDECLIIIPIHIFKKIKFDSKICDSWHMYAVDYCLEAEKMGLNAYVLPLLSYHRSTGVISDNYIKIILSVSPLPVDYYKTLIKIFEKHKNHIKKFIQHAVYGTRHNQ